VNKNGSGKSVGVVHAIYNERESNIFWSSSFPDSKNVTGRVVQESWGIL